MQQESSVGRKILVKQKYLKFIQTEKWCWSFNNNDGTEAAVLLLPWKQHYLITLSLLKAHDDKASWDHWKLRNTSAFLSEVK